MEQLPKRTYKEGGLSKAEQEKATVFFDKLKFYEGTKEMSQERLRRIGELYSNNVEWIEKTLGVSPRPRVITIDKINIVKKMHEQQLGGRNLSASNEIVVTEQVTEDKTMHFLSHEMIHTLSNRVFHIDDVEEIERPLADVRVGFAHKKNLEMVNEAFTQMINLEALAYFRDKQKGPDYISDMKLPYSCHVIIVDEILKITAQKLGKTSESIRHSLYKSYFKGQIVDLKIIEITCGKGSLKLLAEMPRALDPAYIEKLGKQFGIDVQEMLSKMRKYTKSNKEVEVLNGIKIRNPEASK